MNKNDIEIVQNNLVYIRKVLHLSQEELGNLIGVTKMMISNYESGKNKLTKRSYIAIESLITHYKEIDKTLSEETYLIAQKLLTTKVSKVNYIRSLDFEESN